MIIVVLCFVVGWMYTDCLSRVHGVFDAISDFVFIEVDSFRARVVVWSFKMIECLMDSIVAKDGACDVS